MSASAIHRLIRFYVNKLNLTVEPGQRVALVGASSGRKSTLAGIAAGAYQAEEGLVTLDGQSLHAWPKGLLARAMSMVSQEAFFIEGSLRDNLTLWDTGIPGVKIIEACRDADIWHVIEVLPEALSTPVSENGSNFSGGERQRLEIARALLSDPCVLVLDEATSALDPDTEKRVDQNLRLRGCSCLIVAHRLSTVRDCDNILVVDEDRIIASGTRDELWRSSVDYRDLYTVGNEETAV